MDARLKNSSPKTPVPADMIFRFRLSKGPLTMQCQPDTVSYDLNTARTARIVTPRPTLTCAVRKTNPAIALLIDFPGPQPQLWEPVPDLLSSPESAPHFTVEVDNDGRPTLRFGDDEYGKRPVGATAFTAVYRIGNGRAGNVGAEALAHAVQPTVAPLWPAIREFAIRWRPKMALMPRPSKRFASSLQPEFRAEQFVQSSKRLHSCRQETPRGGGRGGEFSLDRELVHGLCRRRSDRPRRPHHRTWRAHSPGSGLASRVRNFLTGYKLAGYDLEIRSAEYVPLEIAFELCVEPDHFRGDVVEAVRQALSNRVNVDGSQGFFHPDNFTFAQHVYLSQFMPLSRRCRACCRRSSRSSAGSARLTTASWRRVFCPSAPGKSPGWITTRRSRKTACFESRREAANET